LPGCTCRDDPPTVGARTGAEVDHPVRLGDHIHVVFGDHDSVPGIDQACQFWNFAADAMS
jgi:hypothetical protein